MPRIFLVYCIWNALYGISCGRETSPTERERNLYHRTGFLEGLFPNTGIRRRHRRRSRSGSSSSSSSSSSDSRSRQQFRRSSRDVFQFRGRAQRDHWFRRRHSQSPYPNYCIRDPGSSSSIRSNSDSSDWSRRLRGGKGKAKGRESKSRLRGGKGKGRGRESKSKSSGYALYPETDGGSNGFPVDNYHISGYIQPCPPGYVNVARYRFRRASRSRNALMPTSMATGSPTTLSPTALVTNSQAFSPTNIQEIDPEATTPLPTPSPSNQQTESQEERCSPDFRLSSDVAETDDHENACTNQFGDGATVADWTGDLQLLSSSELSTLMSCLGITETFNTMYYFVTRDGEKFLDSTSRVYFFENHGGNPPFNWAVHDQLGVITLGSWYDIRGPVLCKVDR